LKGKLSAIRYFHWLCGPKESRPSMEYFELYFDEEPARNDREVEITEIA
jgi:hypothetical protein